MTYLAKPKLHHPDLPKNGGLHAPRLRRRDLDAVRGLRPRLDFGRNRPGVLRNQHRAASRRQALGHRLLVEDPDLFPRQLARLQQRARPDAVGATGANLANRDLIYLGVSGDGDSASIGIGQFMHVLRRGVNMVYIVENNGVYGLTKGQFSATADKGSKAKRGAVNSDEPIDMVMLALQMGATFVARSFSGDKPQLVPLIKAAVEHKGAAFIDVVSPCVAFNNHPGSTKSYDYVREHNEAVNFLDVMVPREPIGAS